jgi:hypothetical protein
MQPCCGHGLVGSVPAGDPGGTKPMGTKTCRFRRLAATEWRDLAGVVGVATRRKVVVVAAEVVPDLVGAANKRCRIVSLWASLDRFLRNLQLNLPTTGKSQQSIL